MLLNMNIFHLSGTQWWPGRPDHELLPADPCQEEEPWVHLPPASDITSWQQWTAPSPCWRCSDVHTAHWQHSEEGKKKKKRESYCLKKTYLKNSCITSKTTQWEQEDVFSFRSLFTHSTAPTHADLRIFSALSTFPTRRARRAKSDQSSCSVRCSCLPKRRNPASVEMVLVLPSGSLATTDRKSVV